MCELFKKRNSIKLKGKEISGDFTARTSIKCAKKKLHYAVQKFLEKKSFLVKIKNEKKEKKCNNNTCIKKGAPIKLTHVVKIQGKPNLTKISQIVHSSL